MSAFTTTKCAQKRKGTYSKNPKVSDDLPNQGGDILGKEYRNKGKKKERVRRLRLYMGKFYRKI